MMTPAQRQHVDAYLQAAEAHMTTARAAARLTGDAAKAYEHARACREVLSRVQIVLQAPALYPEIEEETPTCPAC